jgi:hypothetical protein
MFVPRFELGTSRNLVLGCNATRYCGSSGLNVHHINSNFSYFLFQALSKYCEKRLSASSCLYICPDFREKLCLSNFIKSVEKI